MKVVRGIVKVVPDTPLPEEMRVGILVSEGPPLVPEDPQKELEQWAIGSAEALTLVEEPAD
jgi:hypothetical protein